MNDGPWTLSLAPGVTVRPMAEGTLVLVGDALPLVLDTLGERIVSVCARTTERVELVDVLEELGQHDPAAVESALDQLVSAGVLHAT